MSSANLDQEAEEGRPEAPNEDRLRFLAEASEILGASLDYETELERVARLAVPILADWCVIDLLGEDGNLHRLAIVHRDPERAEAAAELQRRYPVISREQSHTIWQVLRDGYPWVDAEISETRFVAQARDNAHLDLLRRLGFAAEMVVPLVGRGRPLGVITMVLSDTSRRYGVQDLSLAQELARRAALAIDNARLFADAQAAEDRYRALFEGGADAILVTDAAGRCRDLNRAARELLDDEDGDLEGRALSELIVTHGEEDADTAAEALLEPRDRWRGELELRRRDGSSVPVEVRTTLIDLPTGPVHLSVVRDISERRQAELDRQRLVTVVESSADAIVGKTLDGIVTSWNPGAERLYGYRAAEMIERSVDRIYPPERADEMRDILERLRRGEPIADHDSVRLTKSGQRVDVSVGMWPIFDAAGMPIGVASIARDITERKRVEAEQRFLAEASAVLASSLDYEATLAQVATLAVPNLADWCTVYLEQPDGSISRLAMAHADPAQETVARELREDFRIDPQADAGIPRVLRSGESEFYPQASAALLAADADRPAAQLAVLAALPIRSWMIVPLTARERTFGAISLVTAESGRQFRPTDVTLAEDLGRRAALAIDNARLYQEAQDAIRLRDRFLSIAAHELRNPVTVLKGAADLLRRPRPESPAAAERQQRLLQQIGKAADRLVELTNDLLDVSRIQLGQLPLRLEHVDLTRIVQDLGDRFRAQLDTEEQLVIATPEEPCMVDADVGRLEQVLLNLLDNAVKYSPDGGRIEITLNPESDGFLLKVRDEGIGLPPGTVEAIFEPFGRAGNTAGFPGMGLGLAISRSIIERHGGRIWAESAGEGLGTTISLWLPDRMPADGTGAPDPATPLAV